jgi:S1-C subfamily serine protease
MVVPALIENGTYTHPWLGIAGTDLTSEIASTLGLQEARGFLVTDVARGSPADKSGIRGGDMPVTNITGFPQLRLGGDVITGVDHQKINKSDDLLSFIETKKKVGDVVTLTIIREGKLIDIDVVLGPRQQGI